ncbi:MAG: polysaccharide deacetylase family protein [Kiritimatiellae bacterium]|nr:polysaccharide deacetylase family protein [Kiritimatiellia bacterium]
MMAAAINRDPQRDRAILSQNNRPANALLAGADQAIFRFVFRARFGYHMETREQNMHDKPGQSLIIGTTLVALIILMALIGWRIMEYRRVQTVPILMYHHIGPAESSAWCVPPDVFERQMKFLHDQGYTSILPDELAAHQRWGSPLPRRPVIITFDDGYLDSMTMAEPILRKYGLRGMVYLITCCVGEAPDQRGQFEDADCLTWSEVRAIRQRGTLAFGGHSHSHQNLAVAGDPLSLIWECYQQISRNGGFAPDAFCYPHGEYNARAMDAVRRTGFSTAMVCEDTVARTGPGVNLLALPRISVMGGRHRFGITRERDKEAANEIVARVRHEGIPIEVAPCLKGLTDNTAGAWLPARTFGNGTETEWRWTLKTPSDRDQPLSLELWDHNRILPLYP